ncbi:MAG: DinB family protein [Acidimicrobiales bacterium]
MEEPPTGVLDDAFAHHHWATGRVLDALDSLDAGALHTTAVGVYGSILDTMRHLVSADRGYLVALTHSAIDPVDTDDADVATLRAVSDASAAAWAGVLASDPDADEVITRPRRDGGEIRVRAGVLWAQALHHGTDHRSQVCTVLTVAGVEPPAIDAWAYAVVRGRLEVVEPGGLTDG